jgi:hypothetical protein
MMIRIVTDIYGSELVAIIGDKTTDLTITRPDGTSTAYTIKHPEHEEPQREEELPGIRGERE